MKIINQIAILISFPRELDQLSVLIENLNKELIFIIDDFIYTGEERNGNVEELILLLTRRKKKYILLSRVIRLKKYKILISTAQAFQENITFSSYVKYIYAISIGRFMDAFGLPDYFLKTIGRPLNGGGASAKKFKIKQIERLIGEKTIFYPKGLDVNIKSYPPNRLKNIFDLYLCHRNIDMNLIKYKFNNPKCIKIGHPKYDNPPSVVESKYIINNEFFGIDEMKPLLLWMPTHVKSLGESLYNIEIWLPIISRISKNYNIVVRPHPKSLSVNPKIADQLKSAGLIVDLKSDRRLSILYQAADLVLADYGNSVLSSIYMNKKILLLNMPSETEFFRLRDGCNVDQKVRSDIESFEYSDYTSLRRKIEDSISSNKKSEIKNKYFGSDFKSVIEVAHSFNNELLSR